jgi:hypothetical protein
MAPERIYVVGGTGDHAPYGVTQIYNPQKDSWTIGESLLKPRIGLAATTINDKIYAIGGRGWPAIGTAFPGRINEVYVPAEWIPEFPAIMVVPLVIGFMCAIMKTRKKLIKKSH